MLIPFTKHDVSIQGHSTEVSTPMGFFSVDHYLCPHYFHHRYHKRIRSGMHTKTTEVSRENLPTSTNFTMGVLRRLLRGN